MTNGNPIISNNMDEIIAGLTGLTGCLMDISCAYAHIYHYIDIDGFKTIVTAGTVLIGLALGYLYKKADFNPPGEVTK